MLLIKGAHVVDPQIGLDGVMDVLIEGERIARVGERIKAPEGAEVIEADGKYLVPGLTDIHVHFRDPGFEYKETIETGSAAAAAGGFTDVATMPNTDPVVDTGEGIRYQIAKGDARGLVHVRPIGACTRGEKGEALAEIGDMVAEGACMFSDDGHGVQSAGMLRTVMDYVRQFDRAVACHCEVRSLTEHGMVNEGRASTRAWAWPAGLPPARRSRSHVTSSCAASRAAPCTSATSRRRTAWSSSARPRRRDCPSRPRSARTTCSSTSPRSTTRTTRTSR